MTNGLFANLGQLFGHVRPVTEINQIEVGFLELFLASVHFSKQGDTVVTSVFEHIEWDTIDTFDVEAQLSARKIRNFVEIDRK